MFALYKKELQGYFSSLVGFATIILFLVATGIFLWIFPGSGNVLDYGEASLATLFENGPLIFMFIIPAITMRSFSDEHRTGTLEILCTKPLSEAKIILAKYLSSVTVVAFSMLPTLMYYYSIVEMGAPKGNIDHAGTWGAYIGLFLLGATFVAVGIFASSVSKNQVISFMIALLICFVIFVGFEYMATSLEAPYDYLFIKFGINEHYFSMQKGVIDTRDLLYYFSVIATFLLGTNTVLQSRKW